MMHPIGALNSENSNSIKKSRHKLYERMAGP